MYPECDVAVYDHKMIHPVNNLPIKLVWEFLTLLLDAMRCSASNAAYLGIRAFFKQLVTQQTNRPNHSQGCLYTTSSTRRATTAAKVQPPSEHQLPLEVYFSEGSPLSPSTRFDWRLRATSRSKGRLVNTAPTDQQRYTTRKGYVKRVAPPYTRTQPGDDYFKEIHAYNERYVYFFFLNSIYVTRTLLQVPSVAGSGAGRGRGRSPRASGDVVARPVVPGGLLSHRAVGVLDGCAPVWTACCVFPVGPGCGVHRASVPVSHVSPALLIIPG